MIEQWADLMNDKITWVEAMSELGIADDYDTAFKLEEEAIKLNLRIGKPLLESLQLKRKIVDLCFASISLTEIAQKLNVSRAYITMVRDQLGFTMDNTLIKPLRHKRWSYQHAINKLNYNLGKLENEIRCYNH